MPKSWGGVARRGGHVIDGEDWKAPPEGTERPENRPPRAAAAPRPEAPRAPYAKPRRAPAPAADSPAPRRSKKRLPPEVIREVEKAGGRRAPILTDRLNRAVEAYARDRYPEARAILRSLVKDLPGVGAVRELFGLVLYRMGSWAAAVKELAEAGEISGSPDQLPVIADCYRALGRHKKVAETYETLRQAGASAEVVAEGRLVMAGSLADRGEVAEAISLIESAAGRELRRPRLDHLRQWYALGDLYERSGDLPEARRWFLRVAQHDADHADVVDRIEALG